MTVGIARKGFDLDLREGLFHEKEIEQILRGSTIEVKTDEKALTTGNIFVEFECNGKPSGLATTEAQFWMFKIPGRAYILIETPKLVELASTAYRHGLITNGGDYNSSRGVLIPLSFLIGLNHCNIKED